MMNAKTFVLLAVIAVNANADGILGNLLGGATGGAGGLLGGVPIVGSLLGGGLNGLPLVGGLVPQLLLTVDGLVNGLTGSLLSGLLGPIGGVVGSAGGVVPALPLGLQCLKFDDALKQKCSLLNAVTLCENTDCKHTQVCVDVCLNVLNNALSAVTGQCVCQDGFYKDKSGTCVSLQTCLDINLNASGRKKRDLGLGNLLGGATGGATGLLGGVPLVGSLLGGGLINGLPLVGGLVPQLLLTVNGLVNGLTGSLLSGLLGPVGGVLGSAGGVVPALPLGLQCLQFDAALKEKCSLLNAVTLCENTDCKHTQVCVDVCLNVLNNVLSAVTGQCVCQDGFYKDKSGTCVSLQTCLDINLNASG